MTPNTSTADRIRTRMVGNQVQLVREHLEAMQRDAHGLEYDPWKGEVDALWRRIFEEINRMSSEPQSCSLESIRELWTTYITHYPVTDGPS